MQAVHNPMCAAVAKLQLNDVIPSANLKAMSLLLLHLGFA